MQYYSSHLILETFSEQLNLKKKQSGKICLKTIRERIYHVTKTKKEKTSLSGKNIWLWPNNETFRISDQKKHLTAPKWLFDSPSEK